VQIATATFEIDVELGDHDDFGGRNDVGEVRIHFRVDVLVVQVHHR
jgi:hypothetical protein